MHAALQKDTGLRTSRRFSHVFVLDAPLYERRGDGIQFTLRPDQE